MEFGSGILGSEPPMDGSLGGIMLPFQGLYSPSESGVIGGTPPEAGASQHAELDLRHFRPTLVLGCVVELQPFHPDFIGAGPQLGKGLA